MENNKIVVEYALRNAIQRMGVATYKTKKKMPEEFQKLLPNVEQLKNLLK
jgi:hypothetical protein